MSENKNEIEPKNSNVNSAEAEYAITHPLAGDKKLGLSQDKAINLFLKSLTCFHSGERLTGNLLLQEATGLDPSLHERVSHILIGMAREANLVDSGSICYWLGVHSEYLEDYQQAINWYKKAIKIYDQLGYSKRKGRVYCNLGALQLKLGNYPSALENLEMATQLNTKDGMAHYNIGMVYYRASDRGDEKHEKALTAFAQAMAADAEVYGPTIASRMRAHAYEWEEDLKEVLQRASNTK